MPINRAKVSEVSQEKVLNLINDLASKASTSSPVFTTAPVLPATGIAFVDGNQTKEGVVSRTTIFRKTDSYTLASLNERDCLIEISNSLPVTLTIPPDQLVDFPDGTSVDILQTNVGQISIVGSPITTSEYSSGGGSGTYSVTLSETNYDIDPGQGISGTGIASGTLVQSVVGATITLNQPTASQVSGTLVFSVGVVATPGLKLRTRWSSATIFKRSRNSWIIFGDLDA
jgi:hypothetical protein